MPINSIKGIEGTEFPAGRRTRVMVGPGAPLEANGFVMGHVTIFPGGSVPEHVHEQEEVYVIISGKGKLLLAEEEQAVQAGDYAYIPSGQKHCLANTGTEDMIMMFCYAPKSIVEHWQHELHEAKEKR